MATVSELKKNRKICRLSYTLATKKVQEAIHSEAEDLRGLFQTLKNKAEQLFDVDEALKSAVLAEEDMSEEDMFRILDVEETTERESCYNIIKFKCESILQHKLENNENDADSAKTVLEAHHVKRKFQLPKLELNQFDGRVENWIGFWGQFRKIHEDEEIDADDKFQYLLRATEPGTPARCLVESFPPSGDNYFKAIEDLETRFAKDELIIQHYVRKLLELVLYQNNHRDLDLRSLYDKLNTQLRGLETLGVTSDKYAAMLHPLIESTLPEDTLRIWERSAKDKTNQDELQQLMNFLKIEVECEEKVQLARNSFNEGRTHNKPTACIIASDTKHTKTQMFKTGTTSNVEKTFPCIWCEKTTHKSTECIRTRDMTLEQKKEFLKGKKACLICLKVGHYANNCRFYPKCLYCTKRHSIVMCPEQKVGIPTCPEKKNQTGSLSPVVKHQ